MLRNEIVAVFDGIADIMQIKGDDQVKIKTYRNIAITLSYALPDEIQPPFEQNDLPRIHGVGASSIEKISELVDTGRCQYYEELKASIPSGVLDLLSISGVGPSTAGRLYQNLGIDSLESLQNAIDTQKLRNIKGMGKKTEEKLKHGLEAVFRHRQIRPMGYVLPTVEAILDVLSDSTSHISIVGDLRRKTETVKNAEIIVVYSDVAKLRESLANIEWIEEISDWTDSECNCKIKGDVELKIRIVDHKYYGSSLICFTGSESHVVGLNHRANDFGLELLESKSYKGKSEQDIYTDVKLPFIIPELREGSGEIESELPELVDIADIRGDLHVHSTWSDGHQTIKAMAEMAKTMGYEYIAISDHSISSKIANGLDVEQILNKMIEVREINEEIQGIEILMGSEVDILKDGSLDYPENILEKLDVVVASIHNGFNMDESTMTKRIIRAIENKYTHIIGHPTGRLLGKRDPYAVNMDAIIDASAENGKSLEINAYPDRLDLKDVHVRKAKEKGVIITINTDAHSIVDLNFMKYGLYTARRGWLEKKNVLNTLSLDMLMKWLYK
jgi:DNA polymerase (family 10)